MKQSRIFKIAHRSAKNFRRYYDSYAEAFADQLTKVYRLENEAIEEGTIEQRIFIQYLLIEGDTKEAQERAASNRTFLEALQESKLQEARLKKLVALEMNKTINLRNQFSIAA